MAILSKPVGIAMAAVVGISAGAAFGQSTPVLTGAAAYGDWRSDAPGVRRKITPADMPPPYATPSANRHPSIVARPGGAWPKAPAGFAVELFASGLDNPRLLRVAPGGDIFVAESRPGRIRVLRATSNAGAPEIHTFADGLDRPFGIAFWPPGADPRFVYVADTDAIVRFPQSTRRSAARRYRRDDRRRIAAGRPLDSGRRLLRRWCPYVRLGGFAQQRCRAFNRRAVGFRGGARRRARLHPGGQGRTDLCNRRAQLRRVGGAACDRRAVVLDQRARRARRRLPARLCDPRARRRFLRLAVVLHGRQRGPSSPWRKARSARPCHCT